MLSRPSWPFHVAIDRDARTPVFQQIATAVADAVRAGRLSPGDRLPGSRTLADQLDVHRNTVIAAYGELASQSWIETRPGGGSFVAESIPDAVAVDPPGIAADAGFDLARGPVAPTYPRVPPGTIMMAGGVPDIRLVPADLLARAYRRAVRSRRGELLDYGDVRGQPRLRAAIADMLNALRGLAIGPDDVQITRGSQMALALAAQALVAPGDTIAVEGLGYSPAWGAFRAAGARLVPVRVDRDGMDIDRLADIVARERVRAVYVTPHHQYPTLAMMSASRRMALLDLAARERIAVLEDDYDNEFHYRGRPVLPLASADRAGVVVYVGTLSKAFAPGVRIGYLVAPRPMLDAIAGRRWHLDRQGDPAMEHAVAELLEDGELVRHVRRMRRIYNGRRDALIDALRARLDGVVDFDVPPGGMALWLRTRGIDTDAWAEASLRRGAAFRPGSTFAFDGRPRAAVRIAYAPCTEDELRSGVERMAAALEDSC